MKHVFTTAALLLALLLFFCACGDGAAAAAGEPAEVAAPAIADEDFDDETLTEDEEFIPPVCAVDDDCAPQDMQRYIAFQIVDRAGAPVEYVRGQLIEEDAGEALTLPLSRLDAPKQDWTGADGMLYLSVYDGIFRSREHKLSIKLSSYYADTVGQITAITLPDGDNPTIRVVWEDDAPSASHASLQAATPDQDTPPEDGDGTAAPQAAVAPGQFITFLVLDGDGNPVAGAAGRAVHEFDGTVGSRSLQGEMNNQTRFHSGADGKLYLLLDDGLRRDIENSNLFTVELYANFDYQGDQKTAIALPASTPSTITVTWKGPLPPAQRPVQTTGVQIKILDKAGSPVENLQIVGIDYPVDYTGERTDTGFILVALDGDGIFRWQNPPMPGTYKLSAFDGVAGRVLEFEVAYTGKGLQTLELTWPY